MNDNNQQNNGRFSPVSLLLGLMRDKRDNLSFFLYNAVVMVFGLVSFPVLTRLLPVAEYGYVGFCITIIAIATTVSGIGLTQSCTRYYYRLEHDPKQVSRLFSTLFVTALAVSSVFALLMFISRGAAARLWGADIADLLTFCLPLIVFGALIELSTQFFLVQGKKILFNQLVLGRRVLSYIAIVMFVYLSFRTARSYFYGMMIAEASVLVFLTAYWIRKADLLKHFSISLGKTAAVFGMSVMAGMLGSYIMRLGARVVIQTVMTEYEVGLFSGIQNMSRFFTDLLFIPVSIMAPPLIMEMWSRHGKEYTERYLESFFNIIFLITALMASVWLVCGNELFVLFASEKYREAAPLGIWIIAGQFLFLYSILSSLGTFVYDKPHVKSLILVLTAFLNIGLNIVLLPVFGLAGSAYAALISYGLYLIGVSAYSFRLLKLRFLNPQSFLAVLTGALPVLVLGRIPEGSGPVRLIIYSGAISVYFVIAVVVFESISRRFYHRPLWLPDTGSN